MQKEIWKDIPGYEGLYQISNLGRVRSLDRKVISKNKTIKNLKGKVLKNRMGTTGYYSVYLSKNCKTKVVYIHQMVAVVFLNHKPNGYKNVIDHINSIRTDNRLENIQIVSVRYNTSKSKRSKKGTLIGAHWSKNENKWKSSIHFGKTCIHIGYFNSEKQASEAYIKVRSMIENEISFDETLGFVIKNYRKKK